VSRLQRWWQAGDVDEDIGGMRWWSRGRCGYVIDGVLMVWMCNFASCGGGDATPAAADTCVGGCGSKFAGFDGRAER
jgi:hypothetical protein